MFFIYVVGGDSLSKNSALSSVGRATALSGILFRLFPDKQTALPDTVPLFTTQIASRGEENLDGNAAAACQPRLV